MYWVDDNDRVLNDRAEIVADFSDQEETDNYHLDQLNAIRRGLAGFAAELLNLTHKTFKE